MSDLLVADAHQPSTSRRRHTLVWHEWKIASTGLAAIGRKPVDLLTVLIALPVFLLVVRVWTSSQPEQLLDLHASAIGFLVAFYCVKALLGRCIYHRTDGILAAKAQRTSELLAFALPLFGAAAAVGFAYLLIVNAHRPTLWLAATMLGALAGLAWTHIARILHERQPILLRWLRPRHLRRAGAQTMLVAAGAVMGTALAILPFQLPAIAIITVASSLIVSIVLGRIDAAAVRYRTMVGHSPSAIVRSHISPLLTFFGPFAAVMALAPHWAPAVLALVIGPAVVAFVAMRVLAYQSFHRRVADWFVTILIGAIALAGLALPPAAPVAMLFSILWLARRATARAWLIA